MSSSPGTPITSTSTSSGGTQIPDWLSNAAQGAVGTAQALSQRPYTPYTGEQVAPTTPDTNTAYQQVRTMQGQGAPAYQASENAYTGLLGSAVPNTAAGTNANTNTLYGQFAQGVAAPTAGLLANYIGAAAPATAGQVGANATALMSPYSQQVIDPTIAAGQRQLALANQGIAANAANAGAFGGTRQGVAEGQAMANTALGTQQQIGNMLTGGWNSALTPAYNLASQGSAQGLTAAMGLGNMLNSGFNNAQQTAYGLGGQNLTAGLAAAQQLPGVATAAQTYGQKDAGMLQAIGGAEQGQNQNVDNAAMGDFYAAQNWPVQGLDLLTSTLGGVPYSTSGTSTGTSQQSTTQNIPGQILGGVSQAAGIAKGAVDAYSAAKAAGLLGFLG